MKLFECGAPEDVVSLLFTEIVTTKLRGVLCVGKQDQKLGECFWDVQSHWMISFFNLGPGSGGLVGWRNCIVFWGPLHAFDQNTSVAPMLISRLCQRTRPYWETDCRRAPNSLTLHQAAPFCSAGLAKSSRVLKG